jgi:3',5'-cyclic AMP phosphodiesterase CpdA
MKIIQFSDTHLRIDGRLSFGKADTVANLNRTIDFFLKLPEQPDLYILTGDLVDNGVYDAYLYLRERLETLPRPVYVLPGNYDEKTLLAKVFGKMCPAENGVEPCICYSIDGFPLHIFALDTTISHHHGGMLSTEAAQWLHERLRNIRDNKPVLIFAHHPPIISGITVMDKPFINADAYAEILGAKPNLTLCCGHLHSALTTVWRGIPVLICPSVSMLLEVDLRTNADIGFFLGNPSYMLHHYCEGRINSHTFTIPIGADYTGPFPFSYYSDDRREQ